MSGIGLPKGMTRDDAYAQGLADGESLRLRIANDSEALQVQALIDRLRDVADQTPAWL